MGLSSAGSLSESDAFYSSSSPVFDGVDPEEVHAISGKTYVSLGASTTMGSVTIRLKGNAAVTSLSVSAMGIVASGANLVCTAKAAKVKETIAMTSKTALTYTFNSFGDNTAVTSEITLASSGKVVRLASVTMGYSIGTPIAATGVTIDQDDIKVAAGQYNTSTLSATVSPANATYQRVTWASKDSSTASINAKTGVITGVALGSTEVTATDYTGNFTSTKAVTVYDPNDNLLASANDFADFGGSTKAADRTGTNYKSSGSTYDYQQVEAASQTEVLPAHSSDGVSKILVIPVHVKGEDSHATSDVRDNIYKTFFGKPSDTGWESLASYYYKSSFQQLKLEGAVTEWYDLPYTKSEVALLSDSQWGKTYNPTWDILEGAVKWAKQRYNTDLKEFDNNSDGYLDGVWMVYSCDYDTTNTDLWWAFTYNDYRSNGDIDSPMPSKYCWASYSFMNEGYGGDKVDAHTYIHETGHMMGLDDYYTYDGGVGPIGGIDMMDYNIIDHDVFSKFALGWIKPMVVSGACEITLNSAAETGESVLIPTGDSWNGTAFDEYLLLEYYTPTVLNKQDSDAKYPGNKKQGFTERGVRIFHIDARLVTADYNGGWGAYSYTDTIKFVEPYKDSAGTTKATYSMVGASNSIKRSKSGLNSEFKLISLISADNVLLTKNGATNASLFQDGDSFSVATYGANFLANKTTMNDGTTEPYKLSFSDSTDSSIKVTVAAA
jgi:M6 family metalloprotease-like protein